MYAGRSEGEKKGMSETEIGIWRERDGKMERGCGRGIRREEDAL